MKFEFWGKYKSKKLEYVEIFKILKKLKWNHFEKISRNILIFLIITFKKKYEIKNYYFKKIKHNLIFLNFVF